MNGEKATGENHAEELEAIKDDLAKILFHAILGKSVGTTMKLHVVLEGREVFTLVDSGSTHNFI